MWCDQDLTFETELFVVNARFFSKRLTEGVKLKIFLLFLERQFHQLINYVSELDHSGTQVFTKTNVS